MRQQRELLYGLQEGPGVVGFGQTIDLAGEGGEAVGAIAAVGGSKGAVRDAHFVVDVVPGVARAIGGDLEIDLVAGALGAVHRHGGDGAVEVGRGVQGYVLPDGGVEGRLGAGGVVARAVDEDAGGEVADGVCGDGALAELDFVADWGWGAVLEGYGAGGDEIEHHQAQEGGEDDKGEHPCWWCCCWVIGSRLACCDGCSKSGKGKGRWGGIDELRRQGLN